MHGRSLMPAAAWKNYALRGEDANEATSLTRDEFEDKVEESGIRVQLIGRRSRR
jgi:hypothetical protein